MNERRLAVDARDGTLYIVDNETRTANNPDPPDVGAEVKRLKPVAAYLVGSEAALSGTVVTDLIRAGLPANAVFRIAGTNAADTARRVTDTYKKIEAAASRNVPNTAVVVEPGSKEAGAAAAMAAFLRYPVLFVERDAVPAATSEAIAAFGITATVVIGGPHVISDAVASSLPGATRLGGPNVYVTSQAIAGYGAARGMPGNVIYIAGGERPIDAALLGAAVARLGGTVVMTPFADPAQSGGSADRKVIARSFNEGPLGYRMVSADGGVFAFGGAHYLGSTAGLRLARPVVGTASTPGGSGYWLVAAAGGVFAFGDARFFGSTGNLTLNKPIVGMAPTPTGLGCWLVASDGGVFAFGDAKFFGSTGAAKPNQPVVGIAASPTGKGYLLVAADGGVFAFGDAEFRGSTGALKLNKPVVALSTTPGADGYWLIASDDGVFAFGSAPFFGSAASVGLNAPVVAAGR